MVETFIFCWPGKSAITGVEHPAAYHMLDVAAVAERLIGDRYPTPVRDAVILLVALHDLGKIGAGFRAMLRTGATQPQGRHWEVTEALLRHHDDLLAPALMPGKGAGGMKLPAETRRLALYAATAGHHGRPPSRDDRALERSLRSAGDQAFTDSAALIGAFMALWPDASLAGLDKHAVRALEWWLPGFVAAADWIGSNAEWFPPLAAGPDLPEYLTRARDLAAKAVTAAGLDAPAPANGALVDPSWSLRPMQAACRDIALPDGPTLAIIEDETGAGKTEAALMLAQRMMLAGKGQGLFFALPTMATANAMFARAAGVVRAMFDAPPSLTLAHGRAAQSNAFRALIARSAGPTDEPVCTEWLADNRRRALLATVGVGTVDQALLSVLPTRYATLRHYGLSSKILIVDEVHEMGEPYMAQELAALLAAHRMAGGSAILLTATLPLDQRATLLRAWGVRDDGDAAYPALTVAGGAARRDLPQDIGPRGAVSVARLDDPAAAVALLVEKAAAGAACVWVRNAVDDAIAAVEALRVAGVRADLLHARFAMCDRQRHETAALARFGKYGEGRAGQVLVATQVVESSLDLDFDVMISDLAPVAALIQRAGRLWRHMDLRPAASRPVPAPVLHVVSPDPDQVEDEQWLHRVLDRGAWVYPLDLQWRSARALFDAGRIVAPSGLRGLIEAVHGPDAPDVPAILAQAELTREGKDYAAANQARRNLVKLEAGYRGSAAADDREYPTRLGQPTRTLWLARRDGAVLVPWGDLWSSEVQVAESRLRGLALPDQSAPEITALTADWPAWRRETVTVCPVGEGGTICVGLGYDPDRGIVWGDPA